MAENIVKIFLEPLKPQQTTEIFVADEERAAESGLGRFFILLCLDSRERGLKEKMQEFVGWAEKTYYASPIPNPESSLETLCQQINEAWFDFFNKPALWLQKVSILVGVLTDELLIFSQSGRFSGYLVRNKNINSLSAKTAVGLEEKLLTQITSGEILAQDVFIFANYNLFDFFSLEKLKEVLGKLNPEQASEHLKNLLQESVRAPLISGLILKVFGVDWEIEKNRTDNRKYLEEWFGSQESMRQLDNLEKRTGRTLAASIWPNIQKVVRWLFFWQRRHKEEKKEVKNLKLPREKIRTSSHNFSQAIKNFINRLVTELGKFFTTLARNKKLLLIVILILMILIGGSVGYLKWHQKKVATAAYYQQIISVVADKKNLAEAALIYNDKEKAERLLAEANDLLKNNLTATTTSDWQGELENKQKEIVALWNKINNIYEVEIKTEITLPLGTNEQVSQLIVDKSNIYALTNNGVVYNLSINPAQEIWHQEKMIRCVLGQKSQFVCQDKDNNFWLRTETGEFKKTNIVLNGTAFKFLIYNDKIYALNNAIPFLVKVSNPLGAAPEVAAWYQVDKELLQGALDMAIDGNIWLAKEGAIIKLFKGKSENFQLAKLDNPLGKKIIIDTNSDISVVYILDADNQRLIVADKSGNIQKQVINEKLAKADSLVVVSNVAWISDGQKVYQIDMANK